MKCVDTRTSMSLSTIWLRRKRTRSNVGLRLRVRTALNKAMMLQGLERSLQTLLQSNNTVLSASVVIRAGGTPDVNVIVRRDTTDAEEDDICRVVRDVIPSSIAYSIELKRSST